MNQNILTCHSTPPPPLLLRHWSLITVFGRCHRVLRSGWSTGLRGRVLFASGYHQHYLGPGRLRRTTKNNNKQTTLAWARGRYFLFFSYFEYGQRLPVRDSFHAFAVYRQYTIAFSDTAVLVRRTSAQHLIHLCDIID